MVFQSLDSTPDPEIALGPQTFKQAKVEHYLQRAEEYLQMGRFKCSQNTLLKVFNIDPANSAATSLQKRIEYFIASLKRHDGPPAYGGGRGSIASPKRRRDELILIVDQDERVLTSLTSALRTYGFGSVGAGGLDEAIEATVEYKPDMIVSEVNFENGSVGYDLYLWVRTNVATLDLPFLFLATRIDRDVLIAGKRLGVTDFILKPLDEDLVLASIVNSLARTKKENHR